jgi:hypothetical protein
VYLEVLDVAAHGAAADGALLVPAQQHALQGTLAERVTAAQRHLHPHTDTDTDTGQTAVRWNSHTRRHKIQSEMGSVAPFLSNRPTLLNPLPPHGFLKEGLPARAAGHR